MECLRLSAEQRIDDEELRCYVVRLDETGLGHKHWQRLVISVVKLTPVSAAERDRSVHEEKPQTHVQIGRVVVDQVRRTGPDEVRVHDLGDKLGVLVKRDRHAGVCQKLVGQVEYLDTVLARVSGVDVADVFIEPESLSTALLAEYQHRSEFVLAARAPFRARLITARYRYFQVTGERHAEPVMVRIDKVQLCSDENVASPARGVSGGEHSVARAIKPQEV